MCSTPNTRSPFSVGPQIKFCCWGHGRFAVVILGGGVLHGNQQFSVQLETLTMIERDNPRTVHVHTCMCIRK